VNAALFGIDWVGNNDWTMTGQFSFADSLLGTGAIDGTQIDSLFIEVFQGGVSQGSWDMLVDGIFETLNFNFDTTTEMFLVGGLSSGPEGQRWNVDAFTCPDPGVGFGSGNNGQVVCVDGSTFGFIPIANSTLTATRLDGVAEVPAPGTLLLLGAGLAGLILMRRRRLGAVFSLPVLVWR
jgi:hypothetical protein